MIALRDMSRKEKPIQSSNSSNLEYSPGLKAVVD